jgi:hypothetical protein
VCKEPWASTHCKVAVVTALRSQIWVLGSEVKCCSPCTVHGVNICAAIEEVHLYVRELVLDGEVE